MRRARHWGGLLLLGAGLSIHSAHPCSAAERELETGPPPRPGDRVGALGLSSLDDRQRVDPVEERLAGHSRAGDREQALVDAARAADQRHGRVVHEAADLLYHLLVMLTHCDVALPDVEAELARRFGMSGLEEKASRPAK